MGVVIFYRPTVNAGGDVDLVLEDSRLGVHEVLAIVQGVVIVVNNVFSVVVG